MSITEKIAELIAAGCGVCLTGEMNDCDRMECLSIFELCGLTVYTSPCRRTGFLIAANDAKQIKIDAANKLGIPICSPSEFWDAVSLVYPSNQ